MHDIAPRPRAARVPGHSQGFCGRGRAELSEADVVAAIEERTAARAAKDFAAADAVRLRLAGRGVLLMDSGGGTAWRPGLQEPGPG